METNKEKVMRLHNQLCDITHDNELADFAVSNVELGDFDWSYYHENEIDCGISSAIEEYQVIRCAVINMKECFHLYDKDGCDFKEISQDEYFEMTDELDREERADIESRIEFALLNELEGSYAEIWVNLITHEVETLVLLDEDGNPFVGGARWEFTDKDMTPSYYVEINTNEILEKNGYSSDFSNQQEDFYQYFSYKGGNIVNFYLDMTCPTSHTSYLYKQGGFELLDLMYSDKKIEHLTALKIARRHNYTPTDWRRYVQYIDNLIYVSKDYHNPVYVCPTDFDEANTKLMQEVKRKRVKRNEQLRKEAEERKVKEEKLAKNYPQEMASYLNLHFIADGIDIKPLQSIDEFKAEGDAMHHCVFQMEYYKKVDCLIFSAKDTEGNRLATIEFNTKENKIVQCRACCNKVPERDEEIRNLIMSHVGDIKSSTLAKKNQTTDNIAA